MSSHRRSTQYFSRKFNARKALFRGLMVSLVEHGRIRTTVTKAKEIRRHIERAVTLGKEDTVAVRRLLMSRIPNQDTVTKLVTDIGPRFKARPGGYTRIIKLDRRPGDQAEMAFIEFVDYDYSKAAKEAASAEKVNTSMVAAKARKARRKIQNKSRAYNRA